MRTFAFGKMRGADACLRLRRRAPAGCSGTDKRICPEKTPACCKGIEKAGVRMRTPALGKNCLLMRRPCSPVERTGGRLLHSVSCECLVHDLRLAEVCIGFAHGNIGVHGGAVQVFIQGQHITKVVKTKSCGQPRTHFPRLEVEEGVCKNVAHAADGITRRTWAEQGPYQVKTLAYAPAPQGLPKVCLLYTSRCV